MEEKNTENFSDENKVVRVKLVRHRWPDEIAARRKKQRQIMGTILACALFFTAGFALSSFVQPGNSGMSASSNKMNTVYEVMKELWYFGKDMDDLENTLLDGAINGLVDSGGDPHTMYMDAELMNRFISNLEGSFEGVGIQYFPTSDRAVITRIIKNSPAEAAGLLAGDAILKINNQSVEGKTSTEIKSMITESESKDVVLVLDRSGEEMDVTLTRAEIENSAYGYVLDHVGILEISSFAETTAHEVGLYLEEFAAQGINKLIIDLRDNTGGYLVSVVDTASYFLPDDTVILKQEDRAGEITEYKTNSNIHNYDFDSIALLVNENTASAAEVLTAALKEQKDVDVIGKLTYGKGTVQQSIPFRDGSAIKYTVAQWLTPKDNKINGVGITPDYDVDLPKALSISYYEDDTVYEVDSVAQNVQSAQYYLQFNGYSVDRTDGYFSEATRQAILAFQRDNDLTETGVIDTELLVRLFSATTYTWFENKTELDTQLVKAMEVVNGR